MRLFFTVLALLVLAHIQIVLGHQDYCYATDPVQPQNRHFSLLTTYSIAKGTDMKENYTITGCKPKKLWTFIRHGTRFPGEEYMKQLDRLINLREQILANYRIHNRGPPSNALCPEDLDNLEQWSHNDTIIGFGDFFLAPKGYLDVMELAQTMQKAFPTILPKEFSETHYWVRHANTQRSTASYEALIEGLFGKTQIIADVPLPKEDWLLLPYEQCQAWKQLNYKKPGSEDYKFRALPVWNEMLKEVSMRLGFENVLPSTDIEAMFDVCRLEKSWEVDRTSAWCGVFLSKHFDIHDYSWDLRTYFRVGYASEINTRLSCHMMKDMLLKLDSKSSPNAIIYVAHSTILQFMLNALGLFKDNVGLAADNYQNMTNRKWRSSYMNPFTSNIVAVKYDCNDDPIDKERVMFFLNEKIIHFDWCKDGLCSWSEVMKNYELYAQVDCSTYACTNS